MAVILAVSPCMNMLCLSDARFYFIIECRSSLSNQIPSDFLKHCNAFTQGISNRVRVGHCFGSVGAEYRLYPICPALVRIALEA